MSLEGAVKHNPETVLSSGFRMAFRQYCQSYTFAVRRKLLEIFGRDILKHQIKKNRKKEGGRSKRKESGNKNMLYIHPIYRRIWLVTETQIPSLLGSNLCKLSFHAGLTPDDDFKGARFSPQMFKVKLKRKKPSQDSPTCF